MPETLTQTESTQVAPVQAEVKPEVKEDLVTRASKVALEPQAQPEQSQEAITFNVKDIDKITDPVAKKYAEDAYKSFQADYTRKTQSLKAKEREAESFRTQLEQMRSWNPERIQAELNNPAFIQAAQEYQRRIGQQAQVAQTGELSQEELSYLTSEQQKAYFASQEAKNMATSALQSINSMKREVEFEREDMSLKNRYANYEPKNVNQVYNDMMTGKIQATREHLWKVIDYDSAVQRAYELGRQDRKSEVAEKFNASSQTIGVNTIPASADAPVRQPNESFSDHWKRVALNAMQKVGTPKRT